MQVAIPTSSEAVCPFLTGRLSLINNKKRKSMYRGAVHVVIAWLHVSVHQAASAALMQVLDFVHECVLACSIFHRAGTMT